MIDLHTHSTSSDGNLSPSELMKYAFEKKVTTIALTDHDTVSGLTEAQNTAKELGMNFVPGIELSIDWPKGEFHLLGLGLKTVSTELQEIIDFAKDERQNRNIQIAQKLQENGINITYEELKEKYKNENLGRPHFADLMLEKKLIKNRQVAFDKYLAKGRPCYVAKTGAPLNKAILAIKNSGGVPVMAHPLSIYVSIGKIEDTIINLQQEGIVGLECYHPGVRISEASRLEGIARKLDMIVTAGSDFHGEKIRADRIIGHSVRKNKIEERFWTEELMPLLVKVHGEKDLTFTE